MTELGIGLFGLDDRNEREPPKPDPGKLLYHYTSLTGITGILNSGSLWATDARYLNDEQEVVYAAEMFRKKLLDYRESLVPEWISAQGDPSVAGSQIGLIDQAVEALGIYLTNAPDGPRQVFVTSFCQDGDVLSQWRGYAAGNGLAVAFDPAALRNIEPNPGPTDDSGGYYSDLKPSLELLPVVYGTTDSKQIARIMDHAVPPTFHSTRGFFDGYWLPLAQVASIKHPAFREEGEHRLVFVREARHGNAPKLKFRVHPDLGLVPYIDLEFPATVTAVHDSGLVPPHAAGRQQMSPLGAVIKGVVIGPGGNRALRENAVRELLNAYGLTEAAIWLSAAPFRG